MEDFRTVLDAKPLEDCKTDLGIETLLKMNFMTKVSEPGENEAWVVEMFPEAVFVSCYRRRTDKFFIVDSETYEKIRGLHWTCSNGYIRTTEKKPRYLQRYCTGTTYLRNAGKGGTGGGKCGKGPILGGFAAGWPRNRGGMSQLFWEKRRRLRSALFLRPERPQ